MRAKAFCRLWMLCALVLGLLLCALFLPLVPGVALISREGDVLYRHSAPGGRVFILYTHSVNKSPVEDGFLVEGDGMRLYTSRFANYGAGMADPAPGQALERQGDFFVLTGLDTYMDVVWTYVGRIADHKLRIGEHGAEIRFDQVAPPGTLLGLAPKRMRLSDILLYEYMGLQDS